MSESQRIPYAAQTVPTPARTGVLIVAPHPDDEVFGCGGSAARYRAQGVSVQALILTDGGLWGRPEPGLDIVATRQREAIAAAQVLGCAPPVFGNWPDRGLPDADTLSRHLVHWMRQLGSDVLMAPSLWEIHPDHRTAAQAALLAIAELGTDCTLVQYEVGAPLLPNVLVDITPVLAQKQRAMGCFASQLAMQAYDRHINALNAYRSYTLPADVLAAEAMRVATAEEMARDPYGLMFQGHSHPVVDAIGGGDPGSTRP